MAALLFEREQPMRTYGILMLSALFIQAPVLRGQATNPQLQMDGRPLERLVENRQAAERAHLWRVAAWGGANVALGVGLMLAGPRQDQPARFGYGLQSTAWGAINLGIAAAGLLASGGSTAASWTEAMRAENTYNDILLVNLGLNVGYIGVGTALWMAGRKGVRRAQDWKGHGSAVVVQGLGLLVLDGIAVLASRRRIETLWTIAGDAGLAFGFGAGRWGAVLTF